MDKKFAVSLVVNNVPGVMNRIGGIYSKRNYNISSFSGGETEDPRYTRITVVSTGDEYMKDQVLRQLEKLYDVRSILVLDSETAVIAQHMFIKIDVTGTERGSTKHQAVEIINAPKEETEPSVAGFSITTWMDSFTIRSCTNLVRKVSSTPATTRNRGTQGSYRKPLTVFTRLSIIVSI